LVEKDLSKKLNQLQELLEHLYQARRNLSAALDESDISDLKAFDLANTIDLVEGGLEEFKKALSKWPYKSETSD